MDLKIDDFKNIFFGKLNEFMQPLGYKYVKSRYAYILKDKNGWEILVHVICTKWSTSMGITTSIYPYNKVANKIIKKITGFSNIHLVFGYLLKPGKEEMLSLCSGFESMFDNYKLEAEQTGNAFNKWTSNYYNLKLKFWDK